jgi:predicted nucleotidyltransferase
MWQQTAIWQKKCHISNFRNINDRYIYTQLPSFKSHIKFVGLNVGSINLKEDLKMRCTRNVY